MNTTFLSDEDLAAVRTILLRHGLEDFGAKVRLWGRGKAVEVNGTLCLDELRCLIEVARYLCAPSPRVHELHAVDTLPALPPLLMARGARPEALAA